MAEQATNPNDYKVVEFTNKEDFVFTPELGAMYDSRPIFGSSGAPIKPGESVMLPYHVGFLMARNLAKQAMVRTAPKDAKGVPTGVPIWNEESLNSRRDSYLEHLYSEEKPVGQTQTDLLMQKVEEYKAMVDKLVENQGSTTEQPPKAPEGDGNVPIPPAGSPQNPEKTDSVVFNDKADVIAELEKRGIPHDKRKSKDDLEKLLVN